MRTKNVSTEPTDPETQPAVVGAAEAVQEARQVLEQWQRRARDLTVEASLSEEVTGEQLLADPDAVAEIATHRARVVVELEAVRKAVTAQSTRVVTAESVYFDRLADALDEHATHAAADLDEHRRRTARLLAQLEAHEGEYVPRVEVIDLMSNLRILEHGTRWKTPASQRLAATAASAQRHAAAVRTLARGESLDTLRRGHLDQVLPMSDMVPACLLGNDAVVDISDYLERVAAVRGVDTLPGQVAPPAPMVRPMMQR